LLSIQRVLNLFLQKVTKPTTKWYQSTHPNVTEFKKNMKNRLQSNAKSTREGDYIAGQSFNLPRLNHYTEEAWNFLSTFDQLQEV